MSPKIIGLIVLLLFLLIFAVQNTQPVAVKLLFWEISTSAVVTILASFVLGFLSGWLTGKLKPGPKKNDPIVKNIP